MCLVETHLKNDEAVCVNNYTWFGNNRKVKHIRATKFSGEVGILVKNSLFSLFKVQVFEKSHEGIIGIKFVSNFDNSSIIIFCCYLPPEYSTWGKDAQSFFSYLTSYVYLLTDAKHLILCGDFNARIGNMQDIIPSVDDVKERNILDTSKNYHGESFIEFLHDTQMCILNGRISEEDNDYTFLSTRGKSVVDYIVVPYASLPSCNHFKIYQTNDLIQQFCLSNLLSKTCKAPDHAILSMQLR